MATYDPKKKFQYKRDHDSTPLPKDIVEMLRENAYKHVPKKGKTNN